MVTPESKQSDLIDALGFPSKRIPRDGRVSIIERNGAGNNEYGK